MHFDNQQALIPNSKGLPSVEGLIRRDGTRAKPSA
jgi:hypothetical protein